MSAGFTDGAAGGDSQSAGAKTPPLDGSGVMLEGSASAYSGAKGEGETDMGRSYAHANAGIARQPVRVGKPAALNATSRGITGTVFAPINFLRQIGQGACAGLLTFLGATHLIAWFNADETALASIANPGVTDFDGMIQGFAAGGLPGMIEIMGAAALFLNAGRGIGRVVGLMGFVALVMAHANGITHEDLLQDVIELAETVSDWVDDASRPSAITQTQDVTTD